LRVEKILKRHLQNSPEADDMNTPGCIFSDNLFDRIQTTANLLRHRIDARNLPSETGFISMPS